MRITFTKAQTQHLIYLSDKTRQAQQQFDEFVNYLKREYELEGQEWQLEPTGKAFVCADKPEPEGAEFFLDDEIREAGNPL